jgi:hypothetical protein
MVVCVKIKKGGAHLEGVRRIHNEVSRALVFDELRYTAESSKDRHTFGGLSCRY